MMSYTEAVARVFACGVLRYEGGQCAHVRFSIDRAGNVLTVTDAGYIRLGLQAADVQDALKQLRERDDITDLTSQRRADA
jgi:hypothetical protein